MELELNQMMKWLSEIRIMRLQLKTLSTPEAAAQLQPDRKRRGRIFTKEERPPFTNEGLGKEILALPHPRMH